METAFADEAGVVLVKVPEKVLEDDAAITLGLSYVEHDAWQLGCLVVRQNKAVRPWVCPCQGQADLLGRRKLQTFYTVHLVHLIAEGGVVNVSIPCIKHFF